MNGPPAFATWPCPGGGGPDGTELALAFDRGRGRRLLVLPALFDEGNKLRRLTVETLRALDAAGIDTVLPDLPGFNESLASLAEQTIAGWQRAAAAAGAHFATTRVLCVRAGALLAPGDLRGWRYAPLAGERVLRGLLRARQVADREAGRPVTLDALRDQGARDGIDLGGYAIGPALFASLSAAPIDDDARLATIAQDDLPGPGLWLRAEPGEDAGQAAALAARIAGDWPA